METAAFIADLQISGVSLRVENGVLLASPPSAVTPEIAAKIKASKSAIIAALVASKLPGKMPTLIDGRLSFGFDCDDSFAWWKLGSQSLAQTLADVEAPPETVRQYLGKSDAPLHTAMGVQDCKGEIVTLPGLAYCVECLWFYEGGL